MSKKLKVYYDQDNDILYLAKNGMEHEFVEIYPGIHVEFNDKNEFIGLEIINASQVLNRSLRDKPDYSSQMLIFQRFECLLDVRPLYILPVTCHHSSYTTIFCA